MEQANTNTAEISITATVDNDKPVIGSNIIITLTATNAGPLAATSVVAAGNNPSGLEYVSDDGPYSYPDDKWFLSSLAAGQTKVLNITFKVLETGTYDYSTVLSAAQEDSNPADNSDSVTIIPVPNTAEISITATVDNDKPVIGSNIVITLTASNAGPLAATSVVAAGNNPSGLEYVSDDGPYSYPDDKWFLSSLAAGQTKVLNITFKVLETGTYDYSTVLSAAQEDSNPGDNSDSVAIVPIVITKFAIAGRNFYDYAYNNSPGVYDYDENEYEPGPNRGVPFPQQIQLIKDLGASMYRIAFDSLHPDGSYSGNKYSEHDKRFSTTHALYPLARGFVPQAAAAGLPLLAMVRDTISSSHRIWVDGTESEAYDLGYVLGNGWATLYSQWFDYVELSNEMELFRPMKKLLSNDPPTYGDGDKEGHYKVNTLGINVVEIAASFISGMEAGIKVVKPAVKTMFNTAGFFPIYLMDRVLFHAPTIDIIAWHVYSDMPGGYQDKFGISNICDYLGDRYQRPVWITEAGTRWKNELSRTENENRQVAFYNGYFKTMMSSQWCEKVFLFELLDRKLGNGQEDNYGIYRFDPNDYPTLAYTNPIPKAIVDVILQDTQTN